MDQLARITLRYPASTTSDAAKKLLIEVIDRDTTAAVRQYFSSTGPKFDDGLLLAKVARLPDGEVEITILQDVIEGTSPAVIVADIATRERAIINVQVLPKEDPATGAEIERGEYLRNDPREI